MLLGPIRCSCEPGRALTIDYIALSFIHICVIPHLKRTHITNLHGGSGDNFDQEHYLNGDHSQHASQCHRWKEEASDWYRKRWNIHYCTFENTFNLWKKLFCIIFQRMVSLNNILSLQLLFRCSSLFYCSVLL